VGEHWSRADRKPKKKPSQRAIQFADFARFLPRLKIDVVIDVGANVGQTTAQVLAAYAQARIFACEPTSVSYGKLTERFGGLPNVSCHRLAFGSSRGQVRFVVKGTSTGNHVAPADVPEGSNVELVTMETGDHFCESHSLDHVSFLKVDAEGHDLEVLRGFQEMIRHQRIDLLEVEAGISPDIGKFVDFQTFRDFLQPLQYRLLRVYDQASVFHGKVGLRRVNAVFVSMRRARENSK
jgi:FkbM family methyltransferase